MVQDESKRIVSDVGTGTLLEDMDLSNKNLQHIGVEILTARTGGTVHAKRMPGRFRAIKWILASFYIVFFIGPYIQWNGQQAIQFILSERQFHIFSVTILPQDIWMLSAIMLFFALALGASTAIAGRVWCGYLCFQTVWQDVFTWIEEKVEGLPNKRIKLDEEPFSFKKVRIKLPKWIAWAAISLLTSFSFVAYFDDAYDMWNRLFTFDWTLFETTVVLGLGFATFFFAGILREQTCIGFCPYSRIQGAMYDTETIMPTYDRQRGEPRGRIKRAKEGEPVEELGDCIDCNICVAVCPTGVDIRKGQQFGCITCGLCIDACDSVMEKIGKPKGLVRYASLVEFAGKHAPSLFKRPRVLVYTGIMVVSAIALVYGLATLSSIDLKVLHDRSPLYTNMSNGDVQNKYTVKVVNKGNGEMLAKITVEGPDNLTYVVDKQLLISQGSVGSTTLLVRIPKKTMTDLKVPIVIKVHDINHPEIQTSYESIFIGGMR